MQTVLANPITVIKTRLEVVGFSEYSGVVDACRKIYAQEGAGAFFTGLKVSLVRDVPFSGVFYPIYTFFKGKLTNLYEYEMKVSSQGDRLKAIAIISSISSILANIVSCTLTHPLDLIRTRAYFKRYNKDVN